MLPGDGRSPGRRAALALLAALSAFSAARRPAVASELTAAERQELAGHLVSSERLFFDSIRGLSPAQWSFKPAPGRWSIAEVADHLDLAEKETLALARGPLLASPPLGKGSGELKAKEQRVYREIADRSLHRMNRPDFLAPTGRWATPAELMKDFEANRKVTLDYVRTTRDDLRGHALPHPEMGALDGFQWIALLAAHCERHTKQILEVKSDPRFPKN